MCKRLTVSDSEENKMIFTTLKQLQREKKGETRSYEVSTLKVTMSCELYEYILKRQCDLE